MALINKIASSETLYKNLSGFFSVYKPVGVDLIQVIRDMKFGLVKGANQSWNEKEPKYVRVINNEISIETDLSYTVQSSGYRYLRKDFKIGFTHPLKEQNSGIIIGTLNSDKGYKLEKKPILKAYQITARLGILTDDNTSNGNLVERATFGHVNRSKLDRLMASIQATYQRELFKGPTNTLGIPEEIYEEASKGLVVPKSDKTSPQIYEIKCIELTRPYFKIELQTINESEAFLVNLVHHIGLRLKTYAICVQIRRIKYGPIDLRSDSLLQNEWKNFERISENLKLTNKVLVNYDNLNFNKNN